MAERESSVASSTDFYDSEAMPVTPALSAKRKAADTASAQDKKRKLVSPSTAISSDLRWCVGLPPAVWQHVFLFCSLADLGRLMQVNRPFLSYLTDVRNVPAPPPDPVSLRLLKSESVWVSARNALSPRPPKPLVGFTELQMWQLAWSRKCQFCNKSDSFAPGEKPWQKGPGDGGVRTIWPFGLRACGPCLLQQCQTVSRTCPTRNAADFAVLEPSLLGRVRAPARAPLRPHHKRPPLRRRTRTASSDSACTCRDRQILLQEGCSGHHPRTHPCLEPRLSCRRGVVQRPGRSREGANKGRRELGALGWQIPSRVKACTFSGSVTHSHLSHRAVHVPRAPATFARNTYAGSLG
jgi:hypothetical protein